MHSTSERTAAIEKRTRELRRNRRVRRERLIIGASAAACLAVIVLVGRMLPGLTARAGSSGGKNSGTAAGAFAVSGAAGYILIGLLAFALGCGVTVLCCRIHRQNREERDDRDH